MSAMRMCYSALAWLLLTALPGCHYVPTPSRPTLAGPDSGWTNTSTEFTLQFTHPWGDWVTTAYFDWGDSIGSGEDNHLDEPIPHVYSKPGMYLARARLQNLYVDEFTSIYKLGDWSNPCTVHIVSGDSRTVSGRTRD
jgi:hypothetical protein